MKRKRTIITRIKNDEDLHSPIETKEADSYEVPSSSKRSRKRRKTDNRENNNTVDIEVNEVEEDYNMADIEENGEIKSPNYVGKGNSTDAEYEGDDDEDKEMVDADEDEETPTSPSQSKNHKAASKRKLTRKTLGKHKATSKNNTWDLLMQNIEKGVRGSWEELENHLEVDDEGKINIRAWICLRNLTDIYFKELEKINKEIENHNKKVKKNNKEFEESTKKYAKINNKAWDYLNKRLKLKSGNEHVWAHFIIVAKNNNGAWNEFIKLVKEGHDNAGNELIKLIVEGNNKTAWSSLLALLKEDNNYAWRHFSNLVGQENVDAWKLTISIKKKYEDKVWNGLMQLAESGNIGARHCLKIFAMEGSTDAQYYLGKACYTLYKDNIKPGRQKRLLLDTARRWLELAKLGKSKTSSEAANLLTEIDGQEQEKESQQEEKRGVDLSVGNFNSKVRDIQSMAEKANQKKADGYSKDEESNDKCKKYAGEWKKGGSEKKVNQTRKPEPIKNAGKLVAFFKESITAKNENDKLKKSKIFDNILEHEKNIHSARMYTGKVKQQVEPDLHMPLKRLLVRHLATTLLAQRPDMVEVQAAINEREQKIYVACNTKETYLESLLRSKQNNRTLEDLEISNLDELFNPIDLKIFQLYEEESHSRRKLLKKIGSNGSKIKTERIERIIRIQRHMYKLMLEKKGQFKNYKLELVKTTSKNVGQHAETKIIKEKGPEFDYIGGTRRPCTCCFIYMVLKDVKKDTFNPHHGAFWNTAAAWMSVVGFGEKKRIEEIMLELGTHYYNKGATGDIRFDQDTNSEQAFSSQDENDNLAKSNLKKGKALISKKQQGNERRKSKILNLTTNKKA